jgi:hypothetical protein
MMSDLPDDLDAEAIQAYLRRIEDNIAVVKRRLKRFEEEFGMDSEIFFSKLHNAELDERIEYTEWVGEHERLQRLMKQRDELKQRL